MCKLEYNENSGWIISSLYFILNQSSWAGTLYGISISAMRVLKI